MSASSPIHALLANWRFIVAGAFGLLSVGCLWAGFDVRLSIKTATAGQYSSETVTASPQAFALSTVDSLRVGVDSIALSMAGTFEALPQAPLRKETLNRALDRLTFEQDGDVYFTAWEGSRILHSPLTPDTDGMDFRSATDANGRPFVQQCDDMAQRGGGFVRVHIARREYGGIHSSMEPVEQIAYARPIPDTGWHIIAFAPAVALAHENPRKGDDLRTGLRVSGFSFAGLACAMLIPPRRRLTAGSK